MSSKNDKFSRKKNLFRKATQETLNQNNQKETKKSLPNQRIRHPEESMAEEKPELVRKIDPKFLNSGLEYREKNKKWLLALIIAILIFGFLWFFFSPEKKAEIYLSNREIYREELKDFKNTDLTLSSEKSLHVFFDFKKRIGRDTIYIKIFLIEADNGSKKEMEIESRELKVKPEWSYVKYLFQEYSFSPRQEYKIAIYDRAGKLLAENYFSLN